MTLFLNSGFLTPGAGPSRRTFLAGSAATAAAVAVAACGSDSESEPSASASAGAAAGGSTTLGSNYGDATAKAAVQEMVDAFTAESGIAVAINVNGTLNDQISSYLQGRPDDAFTWYAGERMRFFADQGLATPISDVWERISANQTEVMRELSTSSDGEQYLVPFRSAPWVMIYRKSLFADNGYEVPVTYDDFTELAGRMQADGLVPLAFGNSDGWPAMGYVDAINMRLNGHAFHIDLLAGDEKWTDPRVKAVFEQWRDFMPLYQSGAPGRSWDEAAVTLGDGEAGIYFLGTFAAEALPPELGDDLDFFTFPLFGNEWDSENAIDSVTDGFMVSRDPENEEGAKALLEFLSTGAAQDIYARASGGVVSTALDADTSFYTPFQVRQQEIIAAANKIAQYMDRDTNPAFAGANGMQAFLADFIADPEQDLDPYLGNIQAFWDSL